MSQLIPDNFRATISDQFISAFFTTKCDPMIQVELRFDSSLNPHILRDAFKHALNAEPILGCKLIHENRMVFWERLAKPQHDNFTITKDEGEYQRYRNTTLSVSKGPALQGALLQREKGDLLLFKIAHEVTDAAGAKDVVALVAFLYRQLLKTPGFTPAPNINSYRSARQLFRWIPKYAFPCIWYNAMKEIATLVFRRKACNPFNFSCDVHEREYISYNLTASEVGLIKLTGKKYGATINDMFIAVFLRSIYRNNTIANASIRCGISIDLRKWYLPSGRAETVTNLSNIEIIDIGKKIGKTLNDTVKKISTLTARRKKNWIGLNMHCGLLNLFRCWSYETMESFLYRQQLRDIHDHAVFPTFTNLGVIDQNLVTFAKAPVSAYLLVPAGFPPYFGIGISGYNETITITTVVFPQTRTLVDTILNEMLDELLNLT